MSRVLSPGTSTAPTCASTAAVRPARTEPTPHEKKNEMRYTLLGNSGLRVSEVCLGTMTFGTEWGWGADEAESRKTFDLFVEAGGNFIDTADKYTNGTAETIVGRLLHDRRDDFVLASKYSLN